MISLTIDVKGLDELLNLAQNLSSTVDKSLAKVSPTAATYVKYEMQRNTPVDTSLLKNTEYIKTLAPSRFIVSTGGENDPAYYAWWVEYGHAGRAGQYFVEATYLHTKGMLRDMYYNSLKEDLKLLSRGKK